MLNGGVIKTAIASIAFLMADALNVSICLSVGSVLSELPKLISFPCFLFDYFLDTYLFIKLCEQLSIYPCNIIMLCKLVDYMLNKHDDRIPVTFSQHC